jgi:hypothetical protein
MLQSAVAMLSTAVAWLHECGTIGKSPKNEQHLQGMLH